MLGRVVRFEPRTRAEDKLHAEGVSLEQYLLTIY